MVKVATQTPIISLFLLILSLETSFIPSITLNLSVVAFCILFMLYYRRFKVLAWMILLAILPSFANYWAVQLHGDASQAVVLGTRAFVTVCITFLLYFYLLVPHKIHDRECALNHHGLFSHHLRTLMRVLLIMSNHHLMPIKY